jgi:hypothetical protein
MASGKVGKTPGIQHSNGNAVSTDATIAKHDGYDYDSNAGSEWWLIVTSEHDGCR